MSTPTGNPTLDHQRQRDLSQKESPFKGVTHTPEPGKSYYSIRQSMPAGISDDWNEVKGLLERKKGFYYKTFKTREEAEDHQAGVKTMKTPQFQWFDKIRGDHCEPERKFK